MSQSVNVDPQKLPKSADGEAQTDLSILKLTYLRFIYFGSSDSLLGLN
jgi:hypothetical protein